MRCRGGHRKLLLHELIARARANSTRLAVNFLSTPATPPRRHHLQYQPSIDAPIMPRTATKLALPKRFKQGQHIFFWKEIHTNQVLYSFTRQLDVCAVPSQHNQDSI